MVAAASFRRFNLIYLNRTNKHYTQSRRRRSGKRNYSTERVVIYTETRSGNAFILYRRISCRIVFGGDGSSYDEKLTKYK